LRGTKSLPALRNRRRCRCPRSQGSTHPRDERERPRQRCRMRSIAWQGDWPVTQPYGETSLTVEPIYKTLGIHFHCGVDIGMPMDTSLFAPAAGTVTDVGWGRLGIRVGALTHWFIHIDRAIVRVGDPVARGRLVALSGNKVPTGGATTGPHLHFEVQRGYLNHPETSVDPMPVLISAQGAASGELGVFMAALTDAQQLDMYNDIQALRNASVIRDGVTR